jgi:hypothetical protein
MTGPPLLELHASQARLGEPLPGELLLQETAPELAQASLVTIRAVGRLEYEDQGTLRREELPAGPEATLAQPFGGELRIPFSLRVARNAPPSYRGKHIQISWELVASLHEEAGKELTRWSLPLQLQPCRTTRAPEWITPEAPPHDLWATRAWASPLFVGSFCLLPSIFTLFVSFIAEDLRDEGSRAFAVACSLLLTAVSLLLTRQSLEKTHTALKFRRAALQPLARAFPLGATARLGLFLDLKEAMSMRGARLALSAYEDSSKIRSERPVDVLLPTHLAQGEHHFEVALPIPRDFPPTLPPHLTADCVLTLQLEGLKDMELKASLTLAPEVLEEEEGRV